MLSAPPPALDCRSVKDFGLGFLFCFIIPSECLWSIYRVGGGEEKLSSFLGKVDPTTTQIVTGTTALACIQFKF